MSDLETRVCDAIAEGRDDLVRLVSDLVAFDTTARATGDPPRQEADLQRYLGDRLRRAVRPSTSGSRRRPTSPARARSTTELEFAGRPQLAARSPVPAAAARCC